MRSCGLESLEERTLLSIGGGLDDVLADVPPPVGDTLVISEFMADNDNVLADDSGAFPDWIEIHNPTGAEVSLAGWHLTDKNDNLTKWEFPEVSIGSGEYLVVFASGDDRRDPADELHTNFSLKASIESALLVQPDGTPLGYADYPAQIQDISYGLSADLLSQGYFATPSPGGPATEAPIDDPLRTVLISEIMYHPSSENNLEEYIELYNAGDQPVGLLDWRIDDGVDYTFGAVTIGAGEYLVVAADTAAFSAKYPTVTNYVGGWTGQLSNRSEAIELVDNIGGRVDRIVYADQGDWGARELGPLDDGHRGWQWSDLHDGGGRSLELINLAVSNEYGQNWTASLVDQGTPGTANSVAAVDIAPIILDVTQFPEIPRSADPVTVTARVIDELATGVSANLYYRLDGTPAFTSVTMADDGLSGDGADGDGVYAAEIPAMSDGAVVEFYVAAGDNGANLRAWPAPSDVDGAPQQVTNLLYQVDDGFDPDAPWDPESQPIYYMIMTEAERAELADIGDGNGEDSNAQMNGTFISVDGTGIRARYNVGIRNRGHGSRDRQPNNYRVNFAHDDPWKGVTAININAQFTYSQLLGSAIFRMADIAACEATAVQVRVNGADLTPTGAANRTYGSYVHVEAPDSDFADRAFPDDGAGNLYKGMRTDNGADEADFRYEGTDPDEYRDTYFKMTNDEADDWSDLIHMTDVLNNAPDETFLADVGQVIDVEYWMRYLALDALILNRETGLNRGIGDDYMMYSGVDDPRFVLVPHDLDSIMQLSGSGEVDQSIFASANGVSGSDGMPAIKRLLEHPDVTPLYYQAFLDLIEEVYNPAVLDPLIDQAFGPYMPSAVIGNAKQFVVDRTAAVLAQIEQDFTVSCALPIVGGYHKTASPKAAVSGTADVSETRLVRINGEDGQWSPVDGAWMAGTPGTPPTTYNLQNGAAYSGTVDTEIRFSAPTADLNDAASINVDGADGGGQVQGLLRFDDIFGTNPGQVATDAPIASATLTLTVTNPGGNMSLHRMVMPWNETDNWNTFGGDGVQANGVEAAASAELVFPSGSTGTITVDVTQAVLDWQAAPASNLGWVLLPPVTSTNGVDFRASENTTAGDRPRLSIMLDDAVPGSGGVDLLPGVNRLVVEAFDNVDGTGDPLETGHVDVWYEPLGAKEIKMTVRENYLPGNPILVRVEALDGQGNLDRDLWDATVTLSADVASGVTLSTDQVKLYNGEGSALVTATGGGDFTLTATLNEQEDSDSLVDLTGTPMTAVSGVLPAATTITWSDIVHITADLSLPADSTLNIDPGTLILVDGNATPLSTDGVDIDILGTLNSLGTVDQPITFTATDPAAPWGEIHFDNAQPSQFTYTNITRAGHSPRGGHTNTGPAVRSDGTTVTFDHSNITDIAGKTAYVHTSELTFQDCQFARSVMGPEIFDTSLLFEDGHIFEMKGIYREDGITDDDDAIYLHAQAGGQDISLLRSVIANTDDDGIDTLSSTVTVDDVIIRDCFDKGISVSGGRTDVSRTLIVGCDIGIETKNSSGVLTVDRSTIVDNVNGLRLMSSAASATVTSSIVRGTTDTIYADVPADMQITYSALGETWPGTGNITDDPLLIGGTDYHLQSNSPAIDAGDPAADLDPDGTRADMGYYDFEQIWVNAPQVIAGGSITQNTVLTAAGSPYQVTGNLTVNPGVKLKIEPGVTVEFNTGVAITVNGQLLAQGTQAQPITFAPGAGQGAWGGFRFVTNTEASEIAYAHIDDGDAGDGPIYGSDGMVHLDHLTFANCGTYIDLHDASIICTNSVFPAVTSGEPFHSTGFQAGGYQLFEGNLFGGTAGYNDVFDLSGGNRPGGIIRFYNNVFDGGSDDVLDLDGCDAHIEGNVFMNIHQDAERESKSYAITSGTGGGGDAELTIVRNLFYDVDHALLAKQNGFLTFVNNTVVNVHANPAITGATSAVISFHEDRSGQWPGYGAYFDSNIIYDVSALWENIDAAGTTTALTTHRNVIFDVDAGFDLASLPGTGNIEADPLLVETISVTDPWADFALQLGSPAIGAGYNGIDIGGVIPTAASISGEPASPTTDTTATLTVGGPHIYGYKYRVNDGAWSAEQGAMKSVASITLAGSTATVTVAGHGYSDGDVVDIYNAAQNEYNGTFTIFNAAADTFDVTVSGTPATPAGGTITVKRQEPIALSGLTPDTYTVSVITQDSAGFWQDEVDAVASEAWIVEAPAGEQLVDGPTGDPAESRAETPLAAVIGGDIAAGNITADTTLTAAGGPYTITGNVIVDPGVTLTIEPGATLFFENDTNLTINGRLLAEGTKYQQIRFTHVPGGASWEGLQFLNTMEDNRVSWAVLEYATTSAGLVGVENSNLTLDHVTLDNAQRRRIRVQDSSLIVRNSTFTDMFAPGQAPLTDNGSEQIWGGNFPTGGHFILENNVFGTTHGHNDVVDVDGELRSEGGVVMQILNNTFMGCGDDALDVEGDMYVEGNTFMHIRKDQWNTGSGNANVVSAGDAHGVGHEFMLVRNTFYDVDHIVQVKENSYLTLVNNTLVDNAVSAVYFLRPTGGTPGRGAYVDGNIFADTPLGFGEVQVDPDLVVNRTILPDTEHGYGADNIDEDARLADPAGGDFSLLPGSPALGTGPNGLDIGAMVPAGPSISGEPPAVTDLTGATLAIAGPGVTDYKYRVNGGPWSAETPVATDIELTGLTDGDYTVEVWGKNWAGAWQDEADANASKTWTVDTSRQHLRINEVLAINTSAAEHEGTYPDLIELYNDGALPVNLAGMSITDNSAAPAKFVFPIGTTLDSGEYLVVYADDDTVTSGLHLGFKLDGDGEGVYLHDTVANGQTLLDSVEFGPQIEDLSIGRAGHDAQWALIKPSAGAENVALRTGNPATLKINEWFASGQVRLTDDFVELYNPDPLPVDLSGLYLTDDPDTLADFETDTHRIPPLSFVDGGAAIAYEADGRPRVVGNHLSFRLSAEQEIIGLYDAQFGEIDKVLYFPQTTDYAQGRSPDAADAYEFFKMPTPNVLNTGGIEITTTRLIDIDDVWAYDDSGADLGTAWRDLPDPVPAWTTGAGVFGVEADWGANDPTINTPLDMSGQITYYFRKHFTIAGDPDLVELRIRTWLDDGAVFYVNGTPVYWLGIDEGPIDYLRIADRTVGDAAAEGPFTLTIPPGTLVQGDNVLAVEVHQVASTSSDVVFAMTMDSVVTVWNDDTINNGLDLVDGLRITEIMYNPDEDADREFIELKNVSSTTLDLTGVQLSDGIDFTFPAMTLDPGQHVVIVRDLDEFTTHYGPGINVAGEYSGNLGNGGEDIVLNLPDPLEAAVLRFEYDDAWYPATDGDGPALAVVDEGAQENRWSLASQWQAGSDPNGSPGRADGQSLAPGIVINEVLTHTDDPLADAIELYNAGAAAVDIAGLWLSDSDADLLKFQIPVLDLGEVGKTLLGPGEYIVFQEGHYVGGTLEFDQTTEFGGPGDKDFALNGAHGDEVWLVEADGEGRVTRVVDTVSFPAAANGESFGRWPNGSGQMYPMENLTLDAVNDGPRVGPVFISEVMYNPPDPDGTGPILADDLEFIEITNPTGSAVDLWETYTIDAVPQDFGWTIEGFEFDASTTLAAGESILVVAFDPATEAGKLTTFKTTYGLLASPVQIVGGYGADLDDGGETIALRRPDAPPVDEQDFVPYLLVDEVRFDDESPWPTEPDGSGDSLTRQADDLWGNDPASWTAAAASPGDFSETSTFAQVVGRYIFYNNSAYDATDDDAAIAPDPATASNPSLGKEALMPGGTASFQNYTGYSRGINGIMVDFQDLPDGVTDLAATDFTFKVGNNNDPDNWSTAPAPIDISLAFPEGQPARANIIWTDGEIKNEWLQVTVNVTASTGLENPHVFYFGNSVGEVGDAGDGLVTYSDLIQTRNDINLTLPVDIDNKFDFDRSRYIDYTDLILCRNNINLSTGLNMISVPALPPAAPEETLESTVVAPALEPATAVAPAVLHDAVLEESPADSTVSDASLAELAWFYDREQQSSRPSANSPVPQSAVDKLLSTWP